MVGTMALSGPLGQLCPILGLGTEEGPHPGPFRLTDQRLLSDTLSIAVPPESRLSLTLTGPQAGWEDAQRSEPQVRCRLRGCVAYQRPLLLLQPVHKPKNACIFDVAPA